MMILERQKTNTDLRQTASFMALRLFWGHSTEVGTEGQPGELFELKVWGNQTLGQNSDRREQHKKEKNLVQKEVLHKSNYFIIALNYFKVS